MNDLFIRFPEIQNLNKKYDMGLIRLQIARFTIMISLICWCERGDHIATYANIAKVKIT